MPTPRARTGTSTAPPVGKANFSRLALASDVSQENHAGFPMPKGMTTLSMPPAPRIAAD